MIDDMHKPWVSHPGAGTFWCVGGLPSWHR